MSMGDAPTPGWDTPKRPPTGAAEVELKNQLLDL